MAWSQTGAKPIARTNYPYYWRVYMHGSMYKLFSVPQQRSSGHFPTLPGKSHPSPQETGSTEAANDRIPSRWSPGRRDVQDIWQRRKRGAESVGISTVLPNRRRIVSKTVWKIQCFGRIYDREMLSAVLVLCEGNPLVTWDSPITRHGTLIFSPIFSSINCSTHRKIAGDLRHHGTHVALL